jgi:hypothetical protein
MISFSRDAFWLIGALRHGNSLREDINFEYKSRIKHGQRNRNPDGDIKRGAELSMIGNNKPVLTLDIHRWHGVSASLAVLYVIEKAFCSIVAVRPSQSVGPSKDGRTRECSTITNRIVLLAGSPLVSYRGFAIDPWRRPMVHSRRASTRHESCQEYHEFTTVYSR